MILTGSRAESPGTSVPTGQWPNDGDGPRYGLLEWPLLVPA